MTTKTKAATGRAWGYVRVSTGQQAESGLGLEAQRAAIADAARRLGVEVGGIFADEGVSGGLALADRPALLDALASLRRGDLLLVGRRDRLGRDVINVALVEREVARRGARVLSAAGEGSELDGPTGPLVRTILDAVAEFEKAQIALRTRAALRAKRARNERAGTIPFGFALGLDGKLVDDPREREVLDLIQRLRRRGHSYAKIAATLRKKCVPNRGRGLWRAPRVRALLLAAARAA